MTKPEFYLFIGNLASGVLEYAKDTLKNKQYVQQIFIYDIITSSPDFVYGSSISTFELDDMTPIYTSSSVQSSFENTACVLAKKSFANVSATLSTTEYLIFISNLKKNGYKIKIYYVDVPLCKQLKNITKINATAPIQIDAEKVKVINNILKVNVPIFKGISDKFYHIKC